MELMSTIKTTSDADKLSILSQLDQHDWPQQLKLLKPSDWDQQNSQARQRLIHEHLDEINLHIELRACFLDFGKSSLSTEEFNDWYEKQILLAHYIPVKPLLKRKSS